MWQNLSENYTLRRMYEALCGPQPLTLGSKLTWSTPTEKAEEQETNKEQWEMMGVKPSPPSRVE